MPEQESTTTSEAEVSKTTESAETAQAGVQDDSSLIAPEAISEKPDAHALEPGGERFKQVWARAKSAEEKFHDEREQRIRLEERVKVLEEVKTAETKKEADAKTYTWEQLEGWITEGRITRAQANDYRESVVAKQAVAEAEQRLASKMTETQRQQTVTAQIAKYQELVPTLKDIHSKERERAEQEFSFLVQVHGTPKDPVQRLAYEVSALRTAFGDVDSLAKLKSSTETTRENREAFVETHGGAKGKETESIDGPPAEITKDPRRLAHYTHMIKLGRYPNGWKDVREELAFKPPRG